MKSCRQAVLALILSLSILHQSQADELAEQGRAILQENQHAVVTVQLVVNNKFSMPGVAGDTSESRQNATGTMIGADGLTVLSLTSTDPDALLQNIMGSMGGPDSEFNFEMKTELTDLRILLQDNTELPADVVLRDRDQDLVFIRPKKRPIVPMPHIDLNRIGNAQVLDPVISITRLGKVAGRAYAASIERISAVSTRPRTIYFPSDDNTTTTLGSPAFTMNGDVLGIFLMRSIRAGQGRSFGFYGGEMDNVAAIILPGDAIMKVAEQVPEWKEE